MSTTNPLDEWRDFVVSLYPNAGTGTFSVPPLHLNRLSYRRVVVPGTTEAAFVIPNSSGNVTTGTVTPPGTTASGSAPPPGTTASGNVAAGSVPPHGTRTASGGSATPGNVASVSVGLPNSSGTATAGGVSLHGTCTASGNAPPGNVASVSASVKLPGSVHSASGNAPPGTVTAVSVTSPGSVSSVSVTLTGSDPSASNVAHTTVPSGSAPSGNAPPGNVASISVTTGSAQFASNVAHTTVPSGSAPSGNAPPRNVASISVTTGSAQSANSVATSTAVPSLRSLPSGPLGSTACQHGLAPPRVLWTQDPPELTLDNVQESDFHDDFAQNHVVTNLQVLGERRQEPMFILSQLGFGCYLDKPAYSAAAALLPQGGLPKPQDLDTEQLKYSRGEADIILFHRRYGVLIIEIKAVGRWNAVVKNTAAPDKDVVKRIEKAVKQLDKSDKVVSHVVSDIAPGLTVRKCLFLPYIKTEQLERVLQSNLKLAQDLCKCVGASNDISRAVQLCVCAEQLSDPDTYWDVTPTILSKLVTWWQHAMTSDDPTLSGDGRETLYLDIVARFVGPATTVSVHCSVPPLLEVRTPGEAAAELTRRLSRLVLTQEQLDILNRDQPAVFIHGPPGSGKTVLLALQGLRWLGQGHDVHVVSTWSGSLSAARLIQNQLQVTTACDVTRSNAAGRVYFHQYDFYVEEDVDRAVNDMIAVANDSEGELFVLTDELYFQSKFYSGRKTQRFMQTLLSARVPTLRLWGAGCQHVDVPPCLKQEAVTTPLRSAPVIIREVNPGLNPFLHVCEYSITINPAPGDGPPVIRLQHTGPGHSGRWPVDCKQCGHDVAKALKTRLGVGQQGTSPLKWRDVFVITRGSDVHDDVIDDQGRVTSSASGVVHGLRAEDVPVCVLGREEYRRDRASWDRKQADVVAAKKDEVTLAWTECVNGLERAVVVCLAGNKAEGDDKEDDNYIDADDRVTAVSRCITQLVTVVVPRCPWHSDLRKTFLDFKAEVNGRLAALESENAKLRKENQHLHKENSALKTALGKSVEALVVGHTVTVMDSHEDNEEEDDDKDEEEDDDKDEEDREEVVAKKKTQ